MAFSREDLRVKINKLIDTELAGGNVIQTPWIVNILVEKIRVPDDWRENMRDEALLVLREGYRQIVGAIIRARKNEETSEDVSPELVFPGFERLQRVYNIVRDSDGEPIETLVPLALCEESEMRAKLAQLKAMRAGLDIHIKEMETYIDQRWPKAA